MSSPVIKVQLPDEKSVLMSPGDDLDLGSGGLVLYLGGLEADAVRQLKDVYRQRVREAIRFAEERVRRETGQPPS